MHTAANLTACLRLHAAAIHLLGGGINAQSIGNLNFLSNNPSVANFDTGKCCTLLRATGMLRTLQRNKKLYKSNNS